MTDYIWHVALGIGQGTREGRNHLSDEQIAAWRGHVDRALATKVGDQVPGKPGYVTSAQDIGGVLLATVGRMADNLGLCTFAVVSRAQQARKAWQGLHQGYPQFAASLGDVPRAPYCAVRAEYGLALDLDASTWLDAYQVAIAWAWIEKRYAG